MEPTSTGAPAPIAEIERNWMGLSWTAWMPLMAAHPLALAQLPSAPGLYRVRQSAENCRLEWVGWEGRGVRQTVERLARQVHLPVEPYDDPRAPAHRLWSLRQEGASFEVSGAPLPVTEQDGHARAESMRIALGLTTSSSASQR